jgi:5'-nucleotidase
VALAASLVAAGCGGGGGDDTNIPQSGERETTTTTAAEDEGDGAAAGSGAAAVGEGDALQILVTNDDGVEAPGIDALVTALTDVEGVEVTVVAPAGERSGSGGSTTEGELASEDAETAGGYEATAVDGFPADAVRVAFEDMGVEPDLVVSGINEGQNLGVIVDISGTVGAARAAARAGVPALAVSQGSGDEPDFPTAAQLVVAWIDENRDAVASGELPVDVVFNLNVPTCEEGELRGTLEVATSTSGDDAVGTPSDCTSTGEGFTDDISAFLNGYASLSEVAVEPADAAADEADQPDATDDEAVEAEAA